MPDIDEAQYKKAYEQFFEGDVGPMRELCAEDYQCHAPSLGMHLSGRDEALQALRQLVQQVNIRSRVEKIESYGSFVVMHVSGSSDIRGEFRGVDVVRLDDEGRAVETYLLRDPLPPGTTLPTG